jgi:hypothetical protein
MRRAMPYNSPRTLADNEVYALTAYECQDAAAGKMPNHDNFILPYPDRI